MALSLLLLLVGAWGPGPVGRMQSERAPQHTTHVVVYNVCSLAEPARELEVSQRFASAGILILVGTGRASRDLPTWRVTHPRHLALHRGWEPRRCDLGPAPALQGEAPRLSGPWPAGLGWPDVGGPFQGPDPRRLHRGDVLAASFVVAPSHLSRCGGAHVLVVGSTSRGARQQVRPHHRRGLER